MAFVFNKGESGLDTAQAPQELGRGAGSNAGTVWVLRRALAALGVVAVLGAAVLLAVLVGAPTFSPAQVWAALDPGSPDHVTVVQLRIPRAVIAAIVGASLGILGVLLQDVLRNPLAGPELTGAAPGAACGLAVVTVMAPTASGGLRASAVLLGAAVVGVAVLAVASRIRDPLSVAVAGAMIGALVSALTVAVIALASETAVGLLFTALLGSLAGRTWDDAWPVAAGLALAVGSAVLLARRVETVRLGGTVAATIGARPAVVRLTVLAVSTVVTTTIVLVCGPVGFVALATPHLARRLLRRGSTQRVLPAAGLLGAVMVLLADSTARVLASPGEVPLGVATALIGGPILLAVLRTVRTP